MPQFRKIDETQAAALTQPKQRGPSAKVAPYAEQLMALESGQCILIEPNGGETYAEIAKLVSAAGRYLHTRFQTKKTTDGTNSMVVWKEPSGAGYGNTAATEQVFPDLSGGRSLYRCIEQREAECE